MAIYFRSMNNAETAALTSAMARSGEIIDWSSESLNGPPVDKHSTGGVGDKVSFALAPIIAACGCYVPMISGRGLGHSGGTLDKIESVPGYKVTPDIETFKRVVKSVGCAIIGQTRDLAPADRRFYAIRDVTGTVESIPLITASILSKKIAGGNEALIMDIKTGSGAFMPSLEAAKALAQCIVDTASGTGLKTQALITDMSAPLGRTAGNAVEIDEIVAYLTSSARDARLDGVIQALASELLIVAGVEADKDHALERIDGVIASGKASEVFGRMLAALGGPNDFMERHETYLPKAKLQTPIYPDEDGFLAATNAKEIGQAIVALGGGRARVDDTLDLSVGFTEIAAIGEKVGKDRPLAIVHAANEDALARAAAQYKSACTISEAPPKTPLLVYETVA